MRTPRMRAPAGFPVTQASSAAYFLALGKAKAQAESGSLFLGCWPASGSVATPGCVGDTVGPSAQSPGVQLTISNGFFQPPNGTPAGAACKGTTPIPGCSGVS